MVGILDYLLSKENTMDSNLPEVLTIKETSMYLRIPLRTMYKLSQEGKIPCQKVGKHWRYRREALERWLESWPAELKSNPHETPELEIQNTYTK